MIKKVISLFLALLCFTFLFSCKKAETAAQLRIYTLNGTTGFGMAKLMDEESQKNDSHYQFTIKSDASDILAAMTSGDADIAALPTNAAANLYQKTNGNIKILAINTLGCLYVIHTNGEPITSLQDLEGKNVYTPAQNPAFLFQYLCNRESVHVNIDSKSYAQPALLKDAVASGSVEYAVLPEPMLTIAANGLKKATGITASVLNLTEVWDQNSNDQGKLVQGCIVVRTAFLEKNPAAVENFLQAYRNSVEYIANIENLEQSSQMIVNAGIFENAAVAKNALPKCNVHYMDGEEMKTAMQSYLNILYQIDKSAVGGALPDDNFYYIKQ